MEGTSSDVIRDGLREGHDHIKGMCEGLGGEVGNVPFRSGTSGETAVCQVLAVTGLPFVGEIGSSISPGHRLWGRVKASRTLSRFSDVVTDGVCYSLLHNKKMRCDDMYDLDPVCTGTLLVEAYQFICSQ